MPEIYVMVMLFADYKSGMTHEFNSKETCLEARQQILKEYSGSEARQGWFVDRTFISCVKK